MAPSAAACGGTGLPGSRVRRSSVHRRASSWRSGGMPSMVPTTVVGRSAENCSTTSNCDRPSSESSSVSVHMRTRGSSSATRRGVNRRAMSLRICVWSGGSISIIDFSAASVCSIATPPVDVNVAGSCSPSRTSSKRDRAQKPSRWLWYTGASSRSHR